MANIGSTYIDGVLGATRTMPGFALSAIGLGLVSASMQSMRITTLTGIYPTDWTLVARHVVAVAVIVLAIALQARAAGHEETRRARSPFDPLGVVAFLSVFLSCALLVKYLPRILGLDMPVAYTAARIAEEGAEVALVLAWARRALPFGKDATASLFAFSLVAQVAVQLVMSFLQSVPCMVAFALLPLGSLACYAATLKQASPDPAREAPAYTAAEVATPMLCVLVLCILLASLLSGSVLYDSLGVQQEMSSSPLMQLCIILGNLIAAVALIALGPRTTTRLGLPVVLGTTLFCLTASLYLSLILTSSSVGFYLALSSVSIQFTQAMVWILPFTAAPPQSPSWTRMLAGFAAFYLAKCLSAGTMMLEASSPGLLEALSVFGVFALFICTCISFAGILGRTPADSSDGSTAEPKGLLGVEAELPAPDSSDASLPASAAHPDGDPLPLDSEPTQDVLPPEQESAEADGAIAEATEATAHGSVIEGPGIHPGYSYRDAVAKVAREYGLTRREEDVLAYVARGKTAGVIAADMFLSLNTVKSHMRNLYVKLGVHSQVEVVELVESFDEAGL